MSEYYDVGSEEEAEVKVTITDPEGDTPNIFVWDKDKLIAKIWLYPDGRITYRSFVPKATNEILLRKRSGD